MNLLRKIFGKLRWKNLKIRGQLIFVYLFALIIPLSIVGVFLVVSANKKLDEYYTDLLKSENTRVKSTFSQVANQMYFLSNDICFDGEQKDILSREYQSRDEFISVVNESDDIDELIYNNDFVSKISVYTNNPSVAEYKQYKKIDASIKKEKWYNRAKDNSSAFWISYEDVNLYGNNEIKLALVRRIFIPNCDFDAIVVITMSNDYIRSRIDSNAIDAIELDKEGIVFCSKGNWCGNEMPIEIDYTKQYYTANEVVSVEGEEYYASVSTINLYMTNSKLYVATLNNSIYNDVMNITNILVVILALAILIPGVILILFAYKFSGRIYLLREEMHKASNKEYNMREKFPGHDELTEAFNDLKKMVSDIKEKEAQMYIARIKENELINNQQKMEYKMLASQINPHYLYNTLESIRMKSLTMGNKEVADCIKILGKTLQYVLKNTGTTSTTLQKEVEHVENYLTIQKMRFGDRINYDIEMVDGLDASKYVVLPLLLQPIVENAVVHGLENINGQGNITIKISHNDMEELQICVSDNGQGMTEEELAKMQEKLSTPGAKYESSIGVYNICERIRLHYGETYGLWIESQYGKGTKVTLYLPIINQ